MGKLENTLENVKLIARASVLFPYVIAHASLLIIGEEIKGAYYRTFKIPHVAFEHNDFVST
jgi:hypothetical protein